MFTKRLRTEKYILALNKKSTNGVIIQMKNKIVFLLIIIFGLTMFIPVFDVEYCENETDLSEIFEKYENQYPDNEVSLISYTQSTGGVPLCIKKSTNDALCGAVIPLWLINPYGIGEDNFFENKTFLDRKVILVSKKTNPVTFYYDMQYIKVIVPKKVVIINKKDYAENGEQKVYRLYNLSLWGAISLMFKVAVIILLIALLRRVLKRILKRQNAKQEPCRKEQSEDEKGV